MKKIIALLLALIMTFSVGTLAFAEGETIEEPAPEKTVIEQAEELLGEYSWILDLPAGSILPALKIAKIALKFLKVYVKLCGVFGLDPMETAQGIFEYLGKVVEENEELKELVGKVELPSTDEEAPAELVAA